MNLKKIFLLVFPIFLFENISAHCPLCTVGAGAAAAGAVWLGISKVVVALFIGAFAMSMGMWFARVIEKRKIFIPFQNFIIIVGVFLLTVLPLIPIIKSLGPLYIPFIGEYGVTYALDYSLVSSLFGGLIVFFSPKINKKIKDKTGKSISYQGIFITFSLLIIASLLIQFVIV
ncbi:MAG: hypothetical protein Q8P15_00230 [Nanoarchaeota archaeon]|nr:hypothetical protein [Nanoarchaeota archaeon]